MKIFKHNTINLPKLQAHEINNRRYYLTPEGRYYPSVTTLLGQPSKKSLESWKKSIGEEKAKDISEYACALGENLHYVVEKYLDNDPKFLEYATTHSKYMFLSMRDTLDRIDNIYVQEASLYSDVLGLAGRTDCIAEFDGVPSIIDFKTSRKEKKEEWITSYFVQGTTYSLMLEEMTGIKIPQIVILMCTYDSQPYVFKVKRQNYYSDLKKLMDEYLEELKYRDV